MNKAKIIDASFEEVPRQRISKEQHDEIKEAEIPEEWSEKKKAIKTQMPDG